MIDKTKLIAETAWHHDGDFSFMEKLVADILKDADQIKLKNMERGKYFRIAADVIVDGENLADILIEAGMAVRYDGGKKTHKWCEGGE